jgi:16S rRNA (uracil1498-N3)-methyltransferase
MNLFYTTNISPGLAELPEEEARHCIQVLRHQVGDELSITDGMGKWYKGPIVEAGKKRCLVSIEQTIDYPVPASHGLHLAIAPTKNISRMEWLLEKATEIGIGHIHLLLTAHSERRRVRIDRLEKVVLSAMKQSLKAWKPVLHEELIPFTQFLQSDLPEQRFIAYLGEGVKGSLKENYTVGKGVCIMIGPEGGFSPEEVKAAEAVQFIPVSLGNSRLRTETAGLVACHTINLLNES